MTDEMSEKQAEAILREFARGKDNVHSFFTKIIQDDDTTKTGYLNEEELGTSKLPVRTYQELSLFSNNIYGHKKWSKFFKDMSEIQTATSLSRDGILIRLSVTQKKELADVSPKERKANKGWFKKKSSGGEI